MRRLLLSAIVVLLAAAPASADITLRQYKSIKKTEAFKVHLGGVGQAYSWANARLTATRRAPLYCEPAELTLTQTGYLRLLDEEIQENGPAIPSDTPVELLLLFKLIHDYPCPLSGALGPDSPHQPGGPLSQDLAHTGRLPG